MSVSLTEFYPATTVLQYGTALAVVILVLEVLYFHRSVNNSLHLGLLQNINWLIYLPNQSGCMDVHFPLSKELCILYMLQTVLLLALIKTCLKNANHKGQMFYISRQLTFYAHDMYDLYEVLHD